MRVTFRCPPGYEAVLPKPSLAAANLPDWLRAMPALRPSPTLGGVEVRTLKRCPPFLDAMQTGILFPLAADVRIEGGCFSWDWDPPPNLSSRLTRSPLGVHLPEQVAGLPGPHPAGCFAVKFTNFWTVALPEGFSLLIGHPFNREDLPFRTLFGLVDADRFTDGFVHFPALWTDPTFAGTLRAGTPVAQAVPVRRDALDLAFEPMNPAGAVLQADLQDALEAEPGLYRKKFRAKRG